MGNKWAKEMKNGNQVQGVGQDAIMRPEGTRDRFSGQQDTGVDQ